MASQRDINARAQEISSQCGHNQESLSQGGQAQLVRPASHDQSSQESDQSLLQRTGESLKNVAGGAASLAQGAAAGAVNLAQGAAATVKNTLGVNSDSNNPSDNNAANPSANNAANLGANNAANLGANNAANLGANNAANLGANNAFNLGANNAAAAAAANHPSGNTAADNNPGNRSNRA